LNIDDSDDEIQYDNKGMTP